MVKLWCAHHSWLWKNEAELFVLTGDLPIWCSEQLGGMYFMVQAYLCVLVLTHHIHTYIVAERIIWKVVHVRLG